ncbi:MAG: hypothetical protein OEO23_13970 [Gemmatimonadota bacterium]|nr:hypothetical protein [Gemmatimonadota bacterium]
MARTGSVVRQGLIVGLIGYGAVAAFYTLFDVLAARGAGFTLGLMGKVVFRGARDPALLQLPPVPDLAAMIAYNFLHLAVSLAVGLFVAGLVARVEDKPRLGYPVLFLLAAGYLITIFGVGALVEGFTPLVPWWTLVLVNTLAAAAGAAYLARAHPGLFERVRAAS